MRRALWQRAAAIAIARILPFLAGVWLSSYADWRQEAAYFLLLIGSLPDAALVRYLVHPNSVRWPLAMMLSLSLSSLAVAAWSLQLRNRRAGQ